MTELTRMMMTAPVCFLLNYSSGFVWRRLPVCQPMEEARVLGTHNGDDVISFSALSQSKHTDKGKSTLTHMYETVVV